ncbi:MAG: tRNA 2-thiouridine(34) synthase MnmA [Clostridia bacterium]|nr:tRNA 2-thiouridine(34) synthase MnmA [Clostridia bacterium]
MKRVVIGLSGGVDSSVAAAVLKEQGYEVIGITMHLWDGEGSHLSSAAEDAKRVADFLGIPHYVLDFREEFSHYVVDYFSQEYVNGRTPNPCIACNRHLKFDAMLQAAKDLGADKIATGHYAKISEDSETGRYLLHRGAAAEKDQTYVLYNLTQEQLAHVLMPLGGFSDKTAVRAKAEELGIPTANKPDSMEICFIPDKDYAAFLAKRLGTLPPKGLFVDKSGNVLGEHQGIVNYTVGQRKGLGIAFGKPMFVLGIEPEQNQVILGEKGEEFAKKLYADALNFIPFEHLTEPIRADIKVRYSAKPAKGTVIPWGDGVKVEFDTPQRAITPGQAVAFYQPDGDLVLGGATIQRSDYEFSGIKK